MSDISLEVTADPRPHDLAMLEKRLSAFNETDVGPARKTALAVFMRDDAATLVGGVSGYTAWGWLYIQWLWVDERWRGRRIAGRMLAAAEAEATTRGCHGALIDTFNPAAAKSYERQGYQTFGIVPDFPIGRSRIFLRKALQRN